MNISLTQKMSTKSSTGMTKQKKSYLTLIHRYLSPLEYESTLYNRILYKNQYQYRRTKFYQQCIYIKRNIKNILSILKSITTPPHSHSSSSTIPVLPSLYQLLPFLSNHLVITIQCTIYLLNQLSATYHMPFCFAALASISRIYIYIHHILYRTLLYVQRHQTDDNDDHAKIENLINSSLPPTIYLSTSELLHSLQNGKEIAYILKFLVNNDDGNDKLNEPPQHHLLTTLQQQLHGVQPHQHNTALPLPDDADGNVTDGYKIKSDNTNPTDPALTSDTTTTDDNTGCVDVDVSEVEEIDMTRCNESDKEDIHTISSTLPSNHNALVEKNKLKSTKGVRIIDRSSIAPTDTSSISDPDTPCDTRQLREQHPHSEVTAAARIRTKTRHISSSTEYRESVSPKITTPSLHHQHQHQQRTRSDNGSSLPSTTTSHKRKYPTPPSPAEGATKSLSFFQLPSHNSHIRQLQGQTPIASSTAGREERNQANKKSAHRQAHAGTWHSSSSPPYDNDMDDIFAGIDYF